MDNHSHSHTSMLHVVGVLLDSTHEVITAGIKNCLASRRPQERNEDVLVFRGIAVTLTERFDDDVHQDS